MDEGGSKDEGGVKGGGILHLGDHQMWRDSTWSTSGRTLYLFGQFETNKAIDTICYGIQALNNLKGRLIIVTEIVG